MHALVFVVEKRRKFMRIQTQRRLPALLWLVGFCCLVGMWTSQDAHAQNQNSTDPTAFNVQQFRPWGDQTGLFQTQSAQTLGQWGYMVGFYLNYANQTLSIRDQNGSVFAGLVDHQIGADIMAAVGFADWFDLYIAIPLTIYQVGEFPNDPLNFPNATGRSLNGFFLGDIRFGLKFRFLDERKHGISLGLKAFVSVPTAQLGGNFKKFNGEDPISAGGMLTLSREISIVNIAFNFGYRFNPRTQLLNLVVSHELTYGLGLSVDVVHRKFALLAEVAGATAIAENVTIRAAPLDALIGARFYPLQNRNLALNLGVGIPLTPGYGSPLFRVFFGLTYSTRDRDTDKDGLYDFEDKCPKTPGPRDNLGCPWGDRDKDGILDKNDRCPDKPGPKENQGCPWPDTDGDGVLDKDDRCPRTPGPPTNQGCPWNDTDKDGLIDPKDRCPRRPGPVENKGCPWPDTDNDGVTDNIDKCPRTPGPKSNRGCPLAIKRRQKIEILKKIYFDFNKDTIKPTSYPVLDAVANILMKYKKIRIRIEGHTDDVGTPTYNLDLSQRRASAVRRYLMSKGIRGSRMRSAGYGEGRPLIRSTSPEARAKNRRVEFVITAQ
ncbi:MAG: hypothetical protein EP343_11995 [Deltaproteobacteria bacterium]|nr:MAG: hypothetical protein EP343_11995 [Deltaproteobacteria bacterium]